MTVTQLSNSLKEYFLIKDYIEFNPEDIISKTDKSTLFTGSTISTFKQVFVNNYSIETSFFLLQNCLRTQNILTIYDDTVLPRWSSYFCSFGAITNYDNLINITHHIVDFFLLVLKVKENELFLRVTSADKDLLELSNNLSSKCKIEIDSKPNEYYRHKFGMDNVVGRNCNLGIKNNETNEINDIGNIIVLEHNEQIIGVEIAFGLENILCRFYKTIHPIDFSKIANIMDLEEDDHYKMADAIVSSIVIMRNGIKPNSTNRGRVLRKYLKGILYLKNKLNYDFEMIRSICFQYEELEFEKVCDESLKIVDYLKKYELSVLEVEKL